MQKIRQTFCNETCEKYGKYGIFADCQNYFKKVECIEFAVNYDDGKDPRGAKNADICLVGISRTSKTPLSIYLAHKLYKVANIPLVINLHHTLLKHCKVAK